MDKSFVVETKRKPFQPPKVVRSITIKEWAGGKIDIELLEDGQIRLFKTWTNWKTRKLLRRQYRIKKKDWPAIQKAVSSLFAIIPEKLDVGLSITEKKKEPINYVISLNTSNKEVLDEIKKILPRLEQEDSQALRNFNNLLSNWNLIEINTMIELITAKLKILDYFENLILDDKVYERRGSDSIHKFLESNIWILNPRYELLSSDKSMKELIRKGYLKRKKTLNKEEKKRIDFALAHDDENKLVIAEIKRPSYNPIPDDIQQLRDYLYISTKQLTKNMKLEGYLICRQFSDEVQFSAYDSKNIKAITYQSILRNARSTHKDLLKLWTKKREKTLTLDED